MRMVILAAIVAVVFQVFVLAFAASADKTSVRNLPKWVWIVFCIFLPVLGALAYLIFGRPRKLIQPDFFFESTGDNASNGGSGSSESAISGLRRNLRDFLGLDEDTPAVEPGFRYRPEAVRPRSGMVAPDDDPEFLAELDRLLSEEQGKSELDDESDDFDEEPDFDHEDDRPNENDKPDENDKLNEGDIKPNDGDDQPHDGERSQ